CLTIVRQWHKLKSIWIDPPGGSETISGSAQSDWFFITPVWIDRASSALRNVPSAETSHSPETPPTLIRMCFISGRLRKNRDDHWLLTRLSLTYYEEKQYRKSLQYVTQALQIAPYCPLAVWDHAGTLDMLRQKKKALQIFEWLISWGERTIAYGECGEGIRFARSLIAD